MLEHGDPPAVTQLVIERGEHPAVPGEVEIRGQDRPDEGMPIDQLEAGAPGLDGERPDSALPVDIGVVAQEEMIRITLGQAQPGIVDEARGTVGDLGDGRKDPGGLGLVLEVEEPLRHPRTPDIVAGQRLIGHRPARLTALDDVDEARRIAAVPVVVAGEEVAVVVESELLGIAKSRGEDLEVAAVGIHTKYGAAPGSDRRLEHAAALERQVVAAVSDREVELPVGPPGKAVEIVATEGGLHTEAALELFLLLGNAIAVFVLDLVDRGNVRDPDRALAGLDAGDETRELVVPGAELGAAIGDAVAVDVLDRDQAIGLAREVVRPLDGPPLDRVAVVGQTVVEGAGRQVGGEPVVAAIVFGPGVAAMGLGEQHAAAFVDVEGDEGALGQVIVEGRDRHAVDQLGVTAPERAADAPEEPAADETQQLRERRFLRDGQLDADGDAEPGDQRDQNDADQNPTCDPLCARAQTRPRIDVRARVRGHDSPGCTASAGSRVG